MYSVKRYEARSDDRIAQFISAAGARMITYSSSCDDAVHLDGRINPKFSGSHSGENRSILRYLKPKIVKRSKVSGVPNRQIDRILDFSERCSWKI